MTNGARRSPEGGGRQRDAERTKQLLRDAAVAEFSAHGFRGSRVDAIAARAGVNKQLISYYFGSKQGLYDAVSDQWRRDEQELGGPGTALADLTLADVSRAYARHNLAHPDLTRLVIREGVDGTVESGGAQRERFGNVLSDLRRRQAEGELDGDLDPALAGLALFGMTAAPVSFPHIARALGADPDSDGFAEAWADAVGRMVELLSGPR